MSQHWEVAFQFVKREQRRLGITKRSLTHVEAILGGPSQRVVFTDRQFCQTGMRGVGAVCSGADTTIDVQLCSLRQIQHKPKNALELDQ